MVNWTDCSSCDDVGWVVLDKTRGMVWTGSGSSGRSAHVMLSTVCILTEHVDPL